MKTARSLIGMGIGLALMQLVLSTSQGSGKTASRVQDLFALPAAALRSFIDPTIPAIKDRSGTPATIAGYSGTASGTSSGSTLLSA